MKRINNKGFTIIELTLSFVFVFTLAFSMFQLLYNYRVKQNNESMRSQMIDYKNQVTLAIQNDINNKKLRLIDYCKSGGLITGKCLVLHFNDGTTKQLSVEETTTMYDEMEIPIKYINYGGVSYQAPDAILLDYRADYMLYTTRGQVQSADSNNIVPEDNNVDLYKISIPIYHNDLDGNFGINIVAAGYDYDYKEPSVGSSSGTNVQNVPSSKEKDEGRIYDGYITDTTINPNKKALAKESVIVRLKFDSSNMNKFQQIFGNWQIGGSGITLSNRGMTNNKACFSAYVSSNNNPYTSTYREVCSDASLVANTWYTLIGTFDSDSSKMSIYVINTGGTIAEQNIALDAKSSVDASTMSYAIGGNKASIEDKNSNFFYGTISNALVYTSSLTKEAITECLSTSIDTNCLNKYDAYRNLDVINQKFGK